jgi:hypothetical protein
LIERLCINSFFFSSKCWYFGISAISSASLPLIKLLDDSIGLSESILLRKSDENFYFCLDPVGILSSSRKSPLSVFCSNGML